MFGNDLVTENILEQLADLGYPPLHNGVRPALSAILALLDVHNDTSPICARIEQQLKRALNLTEAFVQLAKAAADLPELFSQYRRFDSAQGSEGLGLGLTMVKAVIERHGGRILCQREWGRGFTFSLRLPLLDD